MNRLRFKGDSMMYEDVILCSRYRDKIRVFFIKEDGNTIGWSCLILPPPKFYTLYPIHPASKHTPVYTYVKRSCRKGGFGRRLLIAASKYAVKLNYKPTVLFWDEGSSTFFAGVRNKFPKLVVEDVSEWEDLFDFPKGW
jgi:hypothetical protein